MRFITPYDQSRDRRGQFVGVINDVRFEEINTLMTYAGEVRGGHYHKETWELILMTQGRAELRIMDLTGNEIVTTCLLPGAAILIEPGEVHTILSITDTVWVNALTKRFALGTPDIHRPQSLTEK